MSRVERGVPAGPTPGTPGAGVAADERADVFLRLSELLTGFGAIDLLGTGLAGRYLRAIDDILPPGVLDELAAAFSRLPSGPDREAAAATTILADQKLGPVARNIILMWYRGTWARLPEEWRSAYGTSPSDTDHVVSAEAYQAGLQWVAAGAHPAGARQQGYGAWAAAPEQTRGSPAAGASPASPRSAAASQGAGR
ncbi:MAG TPA: hypothetical protein VG142_13650 [Trebonia sp.]|jgi:hypothetical protein|nr:hypothetical protein [Trebonia sp.]